MVCGDSGAVDGLHVGRQIFPPDKSCTFNSADWIMQPRGVGHVGASGEGIGAKLAICELSRAGLVNHVVC
jgi:hypothetical protein